LGLGATSKASSLLDYMNMRASIVLCAGLALLALLASGAGAKTTWDALDQYSFDRYVVEFNKAYASDDEVASRRDIFESRLAAIKAHNRDASKSWKQGVNQLTDRSEAEIRQLLGYNKGVAAGLAPRGGLQWESSWTGLNELAQKMRVAAINHVDWREKGIISPVKDQGTISTRSTRINSPLLHQDPLFIQASIPSAISFMQASAVRAGRSARRRRSSPTGRWPPVSCPSCPSSTSSTASRTPTSAVAPAAARAALPSSSTAPS
jgi:hypothetical protein